MRVVVIQRSNKVIICPSQTKEFLEFHSPRKGQIPVEASEQSAFVCTHVLHFGSDGMAFKSCKVGKVRECFHMRNLTGFLQCSRN